MGNALSQSAGNLLTSVQLCSGVKTPYTVINHKAGKLEALSATYEARAEKLKNEATSIAKEQHGDPSAQIHMITSKLTQEKAARKHGEILLKAASRLHEMSAMQEINQAFNGLVPVTNFVKNHADSSNLTAVADESMEILQNQKSEAFDALAAFSSMDEDDDEGIELDSKLHDQAKALLEAHRPHAFRNVITAPLMTAPERPIAPDVTYHLSGASPPVAMHMPSVPQKQDPTNEKKAQALVL